MRPQQDPRTGLSRSAVLRSRRSAVRPPALAALAAALALAGSIAPAQAGRPLNTDDAATSPVGTCLAESWFEHAGGQRAGVLALGCGIADGLELDADATGTRPHLHGVASLGAGLKWAGESARFETSAGPLAFGLKAGFGTTHPVGAGWRLTGLSATALASWQATDTLALHLNLGPQRDRDAGQTSTLGNVALAWQAHPRLLGFAELLASDRDPSARGVGLRWWWLPDVLGLDLTATRSVDHGPTVWTAGVGWYGW